MRLNEIMMLLAAMMTAAVASAQDVAGDDDLTLRVNPDFEPAFSVSADYDDYPWLNLSSNHIDLNGADWSLLGDKLSRINQRPFRIVLIGDSHIQADGATSVVRRTLHDRYGSAGRGMITPLRLAGTNEPRDYSLTSGSQWLTSRLVPRRGNREMMFTGVAACPVDTAFDLTVRSTESAFSRIKLFYCGSTPDVVAIYSNDGSELTFDFENYDEGFVDIILSEPIDECTLLFRSSQNAMVFGGMELLGNNSGVEFSSIGNNGATYGSYSGLETGRGLARMESDLVILSLGTNDAWGRMSDDDFVASIDSLVNEIRRENPSVKILLTTPGEAQKSSRRNRRSRARHYMPVPKVGHFRDLIVDYGRRNSLPVYDFFTVAGGVSSSTQWIKAGLFSRDRVHLSWPGYALMGRLMADALIERLESVKYQQTSSK